MSTLASVAPPQADELACRPRDQRIRGTSWSWVPLPHLLTAIAIASCSLGEPSTSPSVSPAQGTTTTARPTSTPGPTPATSPSPTSTRGPTPLVTVVDGSYALAVLVDALPIAAEERIGYRRDLFKLWIDADGDGCNTRKEVLIAEAVVAPKIGARCALSGGKWYSLYDGLSFTDASDLDIDHVVPLAEAWDSGASAWDAARRKAFANDLGVSWSLIAVSAASNRAKGDQDPADWLPPRAAYLCRYLADWVAVKARWGLSLDQSEETAIASATACGATNVTVLLVQ